MSNKRLLKKEIRLICGSLAGECVIAKIAVPGINPETINEIIYDIADLQANSLALVNVACPHAASGYETKKAYADARAKYYREAFRKLKSDFNTRIEKIVKDMNAALPAGQKEANKKAAAEKK